MLEWSGEYAIKSAIMPTSGIATCQPLASSEETNWRNRYTM